MLKNTSLSPLVCFLARLASCMHVQALFSARAGSGVERKERKDYAFRRQFNEKPSII